MRHGEAAIGLIGLALLVIAWLVPPDRISYEVKFTLLGFSLAVVCFGVWLFIHGLWLSQGKQKVLDNLSETICSAIHELLNKARSEPREMDAFVDGVRLRSSRTLILPIQGQNQYRNKVVHSNTSP